eukprot:1136681-Pelagomonas_calceolata.AAC.8
MFGECSSHLEVVCAVYCVAAVRLLAGHQASLPTETSPIFADLYVGRDEQHAALLKEAEMLEDIMRMGVVLLHRQSCVYFCFGHCQYFVTSD